MLGFTRLMGARGFRAVGRRKENTISMATQREQCVGPAARSIAMLAKGGIGLPFGRRFFSDRIQPRGRMVPTLVKRSSLVLIDILVAP